jgi:transposase
MRALTRAREAAIRDRKAATCRRKACVRRHDRRSTGPAPGHPAPLRWLSAVVGPPPAPPMVLHAAVRAVNEPPARRQRLAQARQAPGTSWRLTPVGAALQALRGVPCPGAVPPGAARGALPRVEPPRQRMAAVGLPPAAASRGERRRPGAIPTAGHPHARRALGEGAGASRAPAQGRRHLPRRLAHHPPALPDLRWKAPGRLGKRSRTRLARGKHAHHVVGALARELGGCRGAMAQQVPVTPSLRHAKPDDATASGAGLSGRAAEPPPRCGVTRDGVPRPAGLRVPRMRQAPDGGKAGGSHPTASRRSNRRLFLAPPLPMDTVKNTR